MLSLHFRCWGTGKAIENNICLRAQTHLQGLDFKSVSFEYTGEERREMGQGLGKESGRKKKCRSERQGNDRGQPGVAGSLQGH